MCGEIWRLRYVLLLGGTLLQADSSDAQSRQPQPEQPERRAIVEVFVRSSDVQHQAVLAATEEFSNSKPGVLLHVHDLDSERSRSATERLEKIRDALRLNDVRLPLFYSCNTLLQGVSDSGDVARQLGELLRIDVYVRAGCSRCAKAKAFLPELAKRYPAFEVRLRDLVSDADARQDLNRLVKRYRKSAASVPVIHVCNQLIIGFDSAATTGRRIEKVLNFWTVPDQKSEITQRTALRSQNRGLAPRFPMHITLVAYSPLLMQDNVVPDADNGQAEAYEAPVLPLPPEDSAADAFSEPSLPPVDSSYGEDLASIELPWFGHLTVHDWGMPLFTVIVGLVDGFNPCAMWVLLFLLSILVNLKDRVRILAVAGTFVLISGMAYFAFMAAWLNVFMLIGYLRSIQIMLGLTAIAVGSIHIKDFFAFKKGLSLSIPESAKPTIYERTRRIVNAENLWGALAAASVLAVFVNVVELLCTAGLPALYSEVLTLQGLPAWKNYAYLLLYNIAYMFDDGLMVACVVVTLGKKKMQEQHGRWLKLISGIAIAMLGVVMLARPEWLS